MLLLRDLDFFLLSASVVPAPRSTVALSLSMALIDLRVVRRVAGSVVSPTMAVSGDVEAKDASGKAKARLCGHSIAVCTGMAAVMLVGCSVVCEFGPINYVNNTIRRVLADRGLTMRVRRDASYGAGGGGKGGVLRVCVGQMEVGQKHTRLT